MCLIVSRSARGRGKAPAALSAWYPLATGVPMPLGHFSCVATVQPHLQPLFSC